MNYLAHLYLSGDDEKIMVGNFIGDYVKGRKWEQYHHAIQKGILLHRRIDTFTDSHPAFREAKKLVRDDFGLFSGVIIDFYYDHLLARNWDRYSGIEFSIFVRKVHHVLLKHVLHLPPRVQGFLPALIKNRRLESYAHLGGIEQSLEIMSRYTSFRGSAAKAVMLLQENMDELEESFHLFMNDIILYTEKEFNLKINRKASM